MKDTDIQDLRTALHFLQQYDEGSEHISTPVKAWCELAEIYAKKGGGVPVRPPTRSGPPMLFKRVMPQDQPVLVGLFGSRRRCALLIGSTEEQITEKLLEAARNPLAQIRKEAPPCQEVVYRKNVNLASLPIPILTPKDAGPYITLGLSMAKDPETGVQNISIHRLCVQGPDTLTIWMVPGRHLESFYLKAKAMGQSLPISIQIGLDPAVYIASCCPSPLAPLGFNELDIAGGLRGRPIEISSCLTVNTDCISHAEYVLEGEILPELVPENQVADNSLPEFLGYDGKAQPSLPIVKITAITHRSNALFQTVIGPGYEQSNLLAFGMEAATLLFIRQHVTDRVINAYCSSAGGGLLLIFLQFRKEQEQDDGVVRQAGLAVLGAFRMIKHIVLVDEDVNLFNEEDVWWAMTTRFQADQDLIMARNTQGFPLDPSQNPAYAPSITSPGFTTKAIFDCTVPFRLKSRFQRSIFINSTEAKSIIEN
ncbi:MAG: UbiD family decarboxylase [Mojavia pulchra JT2-VF2]|uniref:UbiD family decarboxylase n=1 Tax=Mojavia pulchra JT2-VF2 TaxID=287848 RepID=A0A951Q6K3_9NOST|nr:UbiD family decarboxylase [Mojavia pulchra JT2-VF2]